MELRTFLFPIIFPLVLIVSFPVLGEVSGQMHEAKKDRATADPCVDFWAYACSILKDKKNTREDEAAAATNRFRDALREEGKRLGVLGPQEKEFLTPLDLSFSEESNRKRIAERFAKDPNKLLEWMKEHLSEGEMLGGIPPEWEVEFAKIVSKDYPDVKKAPWHTLSSGTQRVKSFFNYIFAKADPEGAVELAQLATDRFMKVAFVGLLQQILKKEPGFSKALVDRLLPEDKFSGLQTDVAALKRQLPNISALHAQVESSKLDEINLVKRGTDDQDVWHLADWANNGGGYGDLEIEAGGIFGVTVPGRKVFVLAHELGHAVSHLNRVNEKLRENDERIVEKLMKALGFKKGGDQEEEVLGDWYASQLFAQYLEHSSRSIDEQKNLLVEAVVSCESDEISAAKENHPASVSLSKHPSPRKRTNEIVMAHPYFRKLFQCPSEGAPPYFPPTLAYKPK